MSNRQIPFTLTVEEADNMVFKILVAQFNAMYPTDARMALKAAMHVCDKVVAEFDAIVAKQAKSAQARAAAQARYAGTTPPAIDPAVQAQPLAGNAPTTPFVAPAAPPKRNRRTKAQIAADKAAKAAAAAPQPVPMGQVFTPPFPPAVPPPIPAQPPVASPVVQPAPAPVEPPPVSDFATLAQQAAQQGVPQFAPSAAPPQFVPTPPPSFG